MEGPGLPGVSWKPLEIRPPPLSLLDPEDEKWKERWNTMVQEGERIGVSLTFPWIVPWTRKSHELAFHARETGCFQEIHDALFRAYLQDGKDIGRVDVLLEIGVSCGLDRMETKAVLDVDRYAETVVAATGEAREMGVGDVPFLRLGDRPLSGYPKEDDLQAFLSGSSHQ
jgi:predicted DsbA family dithiol-disulfide isomerase